MSRFFAALQEPQVEPEPTPEAEKPIEEVLEEEDGKKKANKKKKKAGEKEPTPAPAVAQKAAAAPEKPVAKEAPKDVEKPKEEADAEGEGEGEGDEDEEDDKTGTKDGAAKKKKKGKKEKPVSQAAKMLAERQTKKKEEEERFRKAEEEALRKEEEERKTKEEAERVVREEEERIAAEKAAEKQKLKDAGLYMSKADRKRKQAQAMARDQLMATVQNYTQPEATESPEEPKVDRKKSHNEKKAEERAAQVLGAVTRKKSEVPKTEDNPKHEVKEIEPHKTVQPQGVVEEEDDWEKLINADDIKNTEDQLQNKPTQSEFAPEKKGRGKPKSHKKKDDDVKEDEKIEDNRGADFGDLEEEEEEEVQYADEKAAFYVKSKYRCPVICILGHVDTGKTKILDKIRSTNVQSGEAGGITQQIGASFFPQYKLKEEITKLEKAYKKVNVDIPGLLIIDTPGHESFANLRKRGEGMCDFAILVVDVKHSLENQTIESLEMLKNRGTPFIVALNKIDIISQWKSEQNRSSLESLKSQDGYTQNLYNEYFNRAQHDFAQHGVLIQNYWENIDASCNQSVVPTSAHTGEGIPDLLGYITEYCQTVLEEKITPKEEFNCTVMEVKKIDGLGTTIDVILVDGTIKEGDKIVLSGFEGPIETTVRALLTPKPLKELRVKADYIHHTELRGAMGCKISGPGLEKAIAGCSMYKYTSDDELPDLHELLSDDMDRVRKMVKFKDEGVGVVASTLGSLEALLVFLKNEKIPVSNVSIGDISKEDVMRSQNALLVDDESKRKKEYATILAFDVKCMPEAEAYSKKSGVHIIQANIIYHLCDQYKEWATKCRNDRKQQQRNDAVFPCILKPITFFNKKDPIVMGCDVAEGVLKVGTPLCIFRPDTKEKVVIGKVESIEANKKPLQEARPASGNIAVKIKGDKDTNFTAGRAFTEEDLFYSNLSRKSLDCLKNNFKDEMSENDWNLVRKIKPMFQII